MLNRNFGKLQKWMRWLRKGIRRNGGVVEGVIVDRWSEIQVVGKRLARVSRGRGKMGGKGKFRKSCDGEAGSGVGVRRGRYSREFTR